MDNVKQLILDGKAVLGIEFGSTRVKSVLIDENNRPIAQGSHQWENHLVDGLWTYGIDEITAAMQSSYADLRANVKAQYGADVEITALAAAGISAMMHGYMPFDADGKLLVPFRTWRNTNTARAAADLSTAFNFNIPLRWGISHLYQAILDDEPHLPQVASINTLAGYVHRLLTGRCVLGIDDASGVFPIDSATRGYDRTMMAEFDRMAATYGFAQKLESLLPEVLQAGQDAGALTAAGAALLDPSGHLQAGTPFCPPEGDAATGMVATNAITPRTGNVSAGTSSFSMIVLERPLSRPYEAIDIVTTPEGAPVAMVHCNNCTSDLNAWVKIFAEFMTLTGQKVDMDTLYGALYNHALTGAADCGGVTAYNFISGEPVLQLPSGKPLLMRTADADFSLANMMRAHLYASVAVLKIGNDILFNKEHVAVDRLTGHGGLFRTPGVGQRILAAALDSPITVMSTAGEGGAWGIALLASFLVHSRGRSLGEFLSSDVFADADATEIAPDAADVAGFKRYIEAYVKGLRAEEAALD